MPHVFIKIHHLCMFILLPLEATVCIVVPPRSTGINSENFIFDIIISPRHPDDPEWLQTWYAAVAFSSSILAELLMWTRNKVSLSEK